MRQAGTLVYCAAAITLLAGLPASTEACGDKLSVIGGGVTFDQFAAEHRGKVVMLVEPDSPLRAANEELKLRQALQKAGHQVRTVESVNELATVLGQTRVDVVLISWGAQESLAAAVGAQNPTPSMLRVAYKPDPGFVASAARDGECFVLAQSPQDQELVHRVGTLIAERNKPGGQRCNIASSSRTTAT